MSNCRKKIKMKKIIFILTVLFLVLQSCKDDGQPEPGEVPFNPFDTLTYPMPDLMQVPVDSNGFLGLHHYIFSQSCNRPGCHDGTFEPDFRTVESAYNTLVYHPIVKNYNPTVDGRDPLPYRVTPNESSQSMLYKRITEHFLPNFERMPSSGNALSQDKIDLIKNWIDDGAKDIFGNEPSISSPQPACYGLVAFLPNSNDLRVDTFRVDNYSFNPFVIPADEPVELWFFFVDMDLEQNYRFGNVLTYNKIRFSTDVFGFTNASELDMDVATSPLFANSVFSQYEENDIPHFQNVTFTPTDLGFQSGDMVYIRTYVQDDDHDTPTEIPSASAPPYLIQYFAFYVQ